METFLGIDLGASSLKACLINAHGQQVGMHAAPMNNICPAPAQVTQNPDDWHAALLSALAGLQADCTQACKAIEAISFSGGAHIAVLQDATGAVLQPAIMWSDQRAASQAATLPQTHIEKLTGNRPNATWTLPQLIWLHENRPEIMTRLHRISFAKDWLRSQLTGDWQSDASEATGAMLANHITGDWHDDLLAMAGISRAQLPPIMPMTAQAGTVTRKAAMLTGLRSGTPVYQGAIDTSVEWLCCAPLGGDTASVKLASAGVLSFTGTDMQDMQPHPPVSLYPHVLPAHSYQAAGMSNCAAAINWVRQVFLRAIAPTAMQQCAMQAPAGCHGTIFHPYLNGERAPIWRRDATAQLSGMTRATSAADVARAAYEGVGLALTDIWHDMTQKLGQRPDRLFVLGGGAHLDFWVQMLADMMQITMIRPQQTDCSFATALLAATAHGAFTNLTHAAAQGFQLSAEFSPDKNPDRENQSVYTSLYGEFIRRRPA